MGYMAVGNRTLELTKIAAAALAEKLGSEIVAIDLSEQLVLNQVFLLVTGNNEPQLQALSEEVQKKLAQAGEKPCLLYTSPSPRDGATSRMPSSA